MSIIRIPNQRAVINRRVLAEELGAAVERAGTGGGKHRPAVVELLRAALATGRAEIGRRLAAAPSAGHDSARAQAFLIDQLVRTIHDHVVAAVCPPPGGSPARAGGERMAILAVGGYGRGEMAPHSDVDIAFITPARQTAWCEQVIEAMLYFFWDLGLKVGHSSRSLDDMVRMCRGDLTIRTAMLEGRYIWGDQALYAEVQGRFWADVVAGTERKFVAQKLAERDERHKKVGDSRYVVEPNVKEGKGALRDLHTLYWIGKYIHHVREPAELVDAGLLSAHEYRQFRRAETFFWAVRCHLHTITARAEDRLTFDLQREVALRMNFSDRPGRSAVERFMQYYFLQAKVVGNLTGVFLAQLDEQFAGSKAKGLVKGLAGLRGRARTLRGYKLTGGKLRAPTDDWFAADPVRLIELFTIADAEHLEIHPETLRLVARDARLIKAEVRRDPRANTLFLDLLTSRNDPEKVLRWLNEAGVFGRFVPDFARVNAQMQFDMYHHFTVDEHTIRAIGLLARIERGDLKDDHPLASELIHKVRSRRVLYAATLLHDIAKGRGGDHSELGGEIAEKLCPRLGLDAEETALVAWLVRQHLLMSATAFKRDLSDWKTIGDFVAHVQSVDRLRQLMLLTVVDIRAVGPGVWNGWKRQLIQDLYCAAEERLRLGHAEHHRSLRVAAKKDKVADLLGDRRDLVTTVGTQLRDPYWIAEPDDVIAMNLEQLEHAGFGAGAIGGVGGARPLTIASRYYPARGATLVTVIASDHPGLFYRIAGGIHLAGGNIIDARIHTARSGVAVDNFLVQDPLGRPFREPGQLDRLSAGIENALANKVKLGPQLNSRPCARARSEAFDVRPRVLFDNDASSRFTVIEVNARDRPALLNRLARVLFEGRLMVHSAHITSYGERAADTFYVTDLLGGKLDAAPRMRTIERKLLEAAGDGLVAQAA